MEWEKGVTSLTVEWQKGGAVEWPKVRAVRSGVADLATHVIGGDVKGLEGQ